MSGWISVEDRLPSVDECAVHAGWFLVSRASGNRTDMSRYDGHQEHHSYEHKWKYAWDDDITHWMHLPKRPSECGIIYRHENLK